MRNNPSTGEYFVRTQSVTLLQGNDAINVIDRVVSTRIIDSPNSHSKDVLFCDYNGRIIDIGSIYKIQDKILLLSTEKMGRKTRKTLIDGKSWDEQCEIIIADEAIGRISLVTTDFNSIINRLGFDGVELERNRIFEIEDMIAVRSDYPGGSILDVLLPRNQIEDFISMLEEMELSKMSEDRWNFSRIAICVPTLIDVGGMLPTECGMHNQISKNKGCYPGQEVHARLDSRGRTVKRLCLLTGVSSLAIGKHSLSSGSTIVVTSSELSNGVSYSFATLRIGDIEAESVNLDGAQLQLEALTYP